MFAAADAKVAFSYQKARSQADELAAECGSANCHAIASDLHSPESARKLVAATVEHFGRLDILVANHGIWTYTYDDFARLKSASGSQDFVYGYDEYSNRWSTMTGTQQYSFNGVNNHITTNGFAYDAAGNVTNDSIHFYTYDAEGRLKAVDSGNTAKYNYDAFGNRTMQFSTTPSVYNEYVVDLSGRAITAIQPGTTNVYTAEVFAGGRHWVTDNGSALFLGTDWLGTTRALTELNGTFAQLYTSLPWGDGLSSGGSSFDTTSQYTGKEYDPESGLYHFPARQYAPVQGRWLTPDPAGLSAMSLDMPQTWNRYAYVANNPLSNVDPTGLDGCDDDPNSATCGTTNSPPDIGEPVDPNAVTLVFNGDLLKQTDFYPFWAAQYDYNQSVNATNATLFWGGANNFPSITGSPVPSNNSSWGWSFTKAFFGGLFSSAGWTSVYQSIVDEDGCDNLMFATFAGDFNPLPDEGPSASDAAELGPKTIAQAGRAAASAYSVYRGLSVPLRSSIYRGLQSSTYGLAASAEEVVPYLQLGGATVHAVGAAGVAAYNGECH